jgi:hypothetical protein
VGTSCFDDNPKPPNSGGGLKNRRSPHGRAKAFRGPRVIPFWYKRPLARGPAFSHFFPVFPVNNDSLSDSSLSRRLFLERCGMGFGMLGLAGLLKSAPEAAAALSQNSPLAPRTSHFPAKAKHFIHLFANGGPSHLDSFDPKPELTRLHGKPLPVENLKTERRTGAAFGSPFAFAKHGQSGLEISDLFPNLAKCADDLLVIRSMHADIPTHEPSFFLMNCGDARLPRPSLGSWLTYGLGTENQNLPGFLSLCPGGYPTGGAPNWQSAFLPGVLQGTYIDTKHTEVEKLVENVRNHSWNLDQQRGQLDLLRFLNQRHQSERPGDAQLDSRIQSFELAYRMQMEATDAFDIRREPQSIRDLYGDTFYGRQCLIARRLIERGVRVVQVWHGPGQPWDSHDDLEVAHRKLAQESDRGTAALLIDLKQRGLLDETLLLWGGEFGRTPTVELATPGANQGKVNGRDHNHHGFSVWMAGAGVKPGLAYGATDPFGFKAVENPVHVHDLHATILHLFGMDHEKLTFRHSGRDFRLTDVHGKIVQGILA